MAQKRALIVDDSKTARHFLSRILERYEVQVETAESAERALEYLSQSRPDVIFMDHMMPGMDGFQAVRAIKNNPATATIPIMMYTSQAGELYVSQARALGAVGVLPKQIKPVEVEALLQSLHLVGDESTAVAGNGAAGGNGRARQDEVDGALRPSDWDDLHRWLAEMLRHHRHGLREDVEATVARLLDQRLPESPPERPAPRARPMLTPLLMLVLAGLAATFFWLHQDSQRKWRAAAQRNTELMSALESRRLNAAEDAVGVRDYLDAERSRLLHQYEDFLAALEWGVNTSAGYPPGDLPLGDARLELLTGLLDRLQEVGFSGVISLKVHRGDFCLVPDGAGGWQLAPPDMPASSCARVGAPATGDARAPALQSVAFANFRAQLEAAGGPVRVEVEDLGDSTPKLAYPALLQAATAGDWNRVAAVNNRVQLRLLPDADLPLGNWPSAGRR